ncbi:unnamed protein product [Cladocopium goreaui]|uniref:Uncharacterized protein n=1 Tax=Cladocopium goreaui TaxID=2562237 RepID=A0A9P1CSC8_9DINO|nr:unnamed protein product [Cladocopium goreaui]
MTMQAMPEQRQHWQQWQPVLSPSGAPLETAGRELRTGEMPSRTPGTVNAYSPENLKVKTYDQLAELCIPQVADAQWSSSEVAESQMPVACAATPSSACPRITLGAEIFKGQWRDSLGNQVFVCFEDELCKILVAHLSRPPRPDIKLSMWPVPFGGGWQCGNTVLDATCVTRHDHQGGTVLHQPNP